MTQRVFCALILLVSASQAGEPVRLHPENPRSLEWRGKPAILVTSGEHYGAVLNLDFDFLPYLDTLHETGLNLTRTFAGTYREVPGSFNIRDNTLAPKPGRYLAPWKKVRVASESKPEVYDLTEFDPAYFERLKAWLSTASDRDIVVELVLFCPNYEEVLWGVNPQNARNNINGIGGIPKDEPYTLKHPNLLKFQLAFVRRVVTELNGFDNLYYEICNEPYFGGVTLDWQKRIAEEIVAIESKLPKKHLIAQNIANEKAKVEAPVHPEVDILNFHYAEPAAALENLGLGRALADDETGFDGTVDRPYRAEAWLFLLSGGSIFSNLDYSYTPDHEDGSARVEPPTPGGGGRGLREQLGFLKHTVEAKPFLRMKPEPGLIGGALGEDRRHAVLAEPGKNYLVYLEGGDGKGLTLDLPAGRYGGAWLDPARARELAPVRFEHTGGPWRLAPPEHDEDVALTLEREP